MYVWKTAEQRAGGLKMICKEFLKHSLPSFFFFPLHIKTGRIFQTKSNLMCVESGTVRNAKYIYWGYVCLTASVSNVGA